MNHYLKILIFSKINLCKPSLSNAGIVIASVSVKTVNGSKKAEPVRKRPLQTEPVSTSNQPVADEQKMICPCRIQTRLNSNVTALCRGAEFVENRLEICSNRAVGKKAFRSSHLVSFFIPLCEECTSLMLNHYFCPGCGLKCQDSVIYWN